VPVRSWDDGVLCMEVGGGTPARTHRVRSKRAQGAGAGASAHLGAGWRLQACEAHRLRGGAALGGVAGQPHHLLALLLLRLGGVGEGEGRRAGGLERAVVQDRAQAADELSLDLRELAAAVVVPERALQGLSMHRHRISSGRRHPPGAR